jgi:Protein of unknown function (DUF669).
MPLIQPDTSKAQDFGPIKAGTYKAKIVKSEYSVSKKGNPMVVLDFEVMVEGVARPRKSWLVITGEGAMGFDKLMRATGFEKQADAFRDPSVPNPEFDSDWLVGQELEVVVEENIYKDDNGQTRKGDQISTYLKA